MNIKLFLAAALGISFGANSLADVRPYLINGSSDGRVDLVVLGDGFTESEKNVFFQAAEQITEQLLGEPPFSLYRDYFNVRHLFTASMESGADDPSEGVFRDTAFDAAFDCFDISRLICVDFNSVLSEIDRNVEPSGDDIILVIVNDLQYGGSGGIASVTSLNPSAGEIALHEVGHSFGRLADEYTADQQTCDFYGGYGGYSASVPNIEDKTTSALIRWNNGGGPPLGWIRLARQLPSQDEFDSTPGLYDGAALCPVGSGRYRPTFNSKMRSLGLPWDQINSEQLVKRIHAESNSIESVTGASISVAIGDSLSLAIGSEDQQLVPEVLSGSGVMEYEWRTGETSIATDERLDTALLQEGISNVEVFVSEKSDLVRFDPAEYLKERIFLNIAKAIDVAVEPNDLFNQGNVLRSGSSMSGTIEPLAGDSVDYARFFTTSPGRLTLRAASLSGPMVTLIEDGGEQRVARSVGSEMLTTIFDGEIDSGEHYISIAAEQAAGAYAVEVSAEYPANRPSGVQIESTEVSDGEIGIKVMVGDDGGLPLLSYTGFCSDGVNNVTAESINESIKIRGLENDREYFCSVAANNAMGSSRRVFASSALVPTDGLTVGVPVWLLIEAQK